MKKLSVMLCLIALLAFTLNGCGGSGTTDTSYYGGGDSGGTTTAPTVTSCTTNLTPGQTCSITGTGFGSSRDSSQSTVSFVPQVTGGTTLTATTYLSWSDTAIQCVTPSVVTGIQYVVVVNRYTSSGMLYSSTTGSTANMTTGTAATAAPAVASQSPNPATAGASVTLTGTNFPISYGYILVNGTVVSSTFTTTTAVFTIPAGTATGATVTLGGGAGGSTTYSLVIGGGSTTPTITSISPNPVNAGAAITVNGTNLGTGGTFLIGTTAVVPTTWTATAITVTVPAATAVGATTVTVTPTGATAVTANLTIAGATTPLLTNANPNTGAAGTTVILTGTNLGTAGTITFGSTPATATAWAATSITTTVPAGLTAGVVTITVTPTSSTAATISFTVSGTTAASWHTATAFDGARDIAGNPKVIFDRRASNSTEGLVLYNEAVSAAAPAGENGLYAKRFTSAGFGTEQRIDFADGVNSAFNGEIAVDSNGNAISVWEEGPNAASALVNSRRYNVATDSWGLGTSIRQVSLGSRVSLGGYLPKIVFNNSNDAVCLWLDVNSVTANRVAWVAKADGTVTDWTVATPWNTAYTQLSSQNNACTLTRLTHCSGNNVVAALYDEATILQVNGWDGRPAVGAPLWGTKYSPSSGVAACTSPSITFDPSNNVYVDYIRATNVQCVRAQSSTIDWYGPAAPNPWSSEIAINSAAGAATPLVKFDASGIGVFTFLDGDNLMKVRNYTGPAWALGSFATAKEIDIPSYTAGAATPDLAFNSGKTTGIIVMRQNDGTTNRIVANVYSSATASFAGGAAIDDKPSGGSAAPNVALGSTTGMAVFTETTTKVRCFSNSYY